MSQFGQTQTIYDDIAYNKFRIAYEKKFRMSKYGNQVSKEQCDQMAQSLWKDFNSGQRKYFDELEDEKEEIEEKEGKIEKTVQIPEIQEIDLISQSEQSLQVENAQEPQDQILTQPSTTGLTGFNFFKHHRKNMGEKDESAIEQKWDQLPEKEKQKFRLVKHCQNFNKQMEELEKLANKSLSEEEEVAVEEPVAPEKADDIQYQPTEEAIQLRQYESPFKRQKTQLKPAQPELQQPPLVNSPQPQPYQIQSQTQPAQHQLQWPQVMNFAAPQTMQPNYHFQLSQIKHQPTFQPNQPQIVYNHGQNQVPYPNSGPATSKLMPFDYFVRTNFTKYMTEQNIDSVEALKFCKEKWCKLDVAELKLYIGMAIYEQRQK